MNIKAKIFKIDNLKDIKRTFKSLFNEYYNDKENNLSDVKYRNLIYSLNVYRQILSDNDIENRIEKLEQMLNESEK